MVGESPRRSMLEVRDLRVSFPVRSGLLRRVTGEIEAVAGVSFSVGEGETFGLVGESGCGKSTIARSMVGLESVKRGRVWLEGKEISSLPEDEMRAVRGDLQMLFQDPYGSLNPRRTVWQLLTEAWEIHPHLVGEEHWDDEVGKLLERVGLSYEHAHKYPHEFSGGQRQRISIARVLAVKPKVILLDEPVSALDVSIQAQILNLLSDLQRDMGLTYVVIAHDLAVVQHISQFIGVMYLGRIVERGDVGSVFDRPEHPYTQALLSAVPILKPWHEQGRERIILEGDVPSPSKPPSGCRFRTRCWKAEARCETEEPELEVRGGQQVTACHYVDHESEVNV